jgi:hypothetical protein
MVCKPASIAFGCSCALLVSDLCAACDRETWNGQKLEKTLVMKDLKQRILDYNFEEDELDEVGEMTSADELFTVLNQLLASDDTEAVNITLGFIRDFMTMNLSPEREAIRDRYPESSLVKTIEQLLFRPNHHMRQAAIYTVGKTRSYSSVDTMTQAFYQFRDSDPILLPKLLGELDWIGGKAFGECVMSMAESPIYMTRWASISMLAFDDLHDDEMYQRKSLRLQQFRHDENILIRQEAEYTYQEQRLSEEMSVEDQLLRREQRKIVRQGKRGNRMKQLHQCRKNLYEQKLKGFAKEYEPKFYFDAIATAFRNRLYLLKQADYTIVEFEAFIPQYVAFREQLRQTQKDNYTFEELDIFIASYAEEPLI